MSVIFMAATFVLMDPFIDIMGVGDIRSECHGYAIPMIAGAPAIVFNGTVAGMLRGEG